MTLLGSEHSLLIRSKFRSVLQLRLQQRRTREQLADQGIMPPLKSPAVYHDQRRSLERAKTEDYLKHKIRSRPEKTDLVNMHILQDTPAEGKLQATQMKLKRARLADDLNEKIAQRPGPLELVKKNIIPVDSAVKEAINVGQVNFPKAPDTFSFEEDSSNDALSPEQPRSQESQGSESLLPETKFTESSSPLATTTIQYLPHLSQQCDLNRCTPNNQIRQPGSQNQLNGQVSTPIPVPAIVKTKPSSDGKNQRHKKPKDTKPKVKKLKYHQYIPPDQKPEKSLPPMDSAYARLLQQQQLFLQLQILSQQQHHQQHQYNYQNILSTPMKQSGDQISRNTCTSATTMPGSSLSPVRSTIPGQTTCCPLKPGPLPSNLDDLKVSELRQQLRIRGLPVSGTKTALMKRLKPFQESSSNNLPTSSTGTTLSSSLGEVTTAPFPMAPITSLSSFQTQTATTVLTNGVYQFGSTSSTPPISPASSDLSVTGSDLSGLPDSFSDVPVPSPQLGLQPSPVPLSAEDSLMGSMNGGSMHGEMEVFDTQRDKMLMEKQKVIEELTWKLHMEQKQVEELKIQLQKQKRNNLHDHQQLPAVQPLFSVSVKQENLMSSCPFAGQRVNSRSVTPMISSTSSNSSTESLNTCGTPHKAGVVNSQVCGETTEHGTVRSPPFLSPQCSPQHSPLGALAGSPRHASLPPSPSNHFLLPVSPAPLNGDGRSGSPHQLQSIPACNTQLKMQGSKGQDPQQQNSSPQFQQQLQQHIIRQQILRKMNAPNSPNQVGQKFVINGASFCNSNSILSKIKQPPSYEDAVKQQMTRSQMDDLLDVLIESGDVSVLGLLHCQSEAKHRLEEQHHLFRLGSLQSSEMPPNAKNDHHCAQKSVPQITVSSGASTVTVHRTSSSPFNHMSPPQLSFDHCASNSDNQLEALLNSRSSLSRGTDITLLKIGSEDSQLDSIGEGFTSNSREDMLNARDILENPLSPMETQMSPCSTHSHVINLGLTETPLENMDWLDLTPPSSTAGFGSAGSSTPSIFSADFLDVTDLNLNTTMNLQW
ncbi:myocardin isoform X3 [Leucoraja erinacea]|uniref:myocardin isoform X3 n=1 Tax=Leucoraja erinaceus TaxID=7782 RepID=UPI0024556F9A|nr:myocardin isoform X3 [Leucoraja erinacea]